MKFAIIKNDKIVYKYESEKQEVFGGEWSSENATQLQIPENISLEFAVYANGEIVEVRPVKTYSELRREAYDKEGCSHAEIMDALIQKEFDNDSTAMGLINAKRILIKQRYSKP